MVRCLALSVEDVIGKDCHEAFGGPFCGSRCSFQDGPPDSLDHLYYPLNILTKKGAARRIEITVNGKENETGRFVGIIASLR